MACAKDCIAQSIRPWFGRMCNRWVLYLGAYRVGSRPAGPPRIFEGKACLSDPCLEDEVRVDRTGSYIPGSTQDEHAGQKRWELPTLP